MSTLASDIISAEPTALRWHEPSALRTGAKTVSLPNAGWTSSLSCVSAWAGGSIHKGGSEEEVHICGASIDSRTIRPGEIFVALKGAEADGHDYVDAAFAQGASAAIVSRQETLRNRPGVVVPDTLTALGDLAHAVRWHEPLIPWVGITGSNGKTTTREMIARILSTVGHTWASPRNWNNFVGLPLTLLSTPLDARFGVAEMGTNRPGEIERLAYITMPTVAIVTSVSPAHLEGFGDVAGVAREKAEIFRHTPPDGLNIYPAQCRERWILEQGIRTRCATFAIEHEADLTATDVTATTDGMMFTISGMHFHTRLWGRHNVSNALAALLACRHLGVSLADAREALSEFHPVNDRLDPIKTRYLTILNDVYNANPDSLEAGLSVLLEWDGGHRRVVVMGDMLELGAQSRYWHEAAGRKIAESGVDVLLVGGPESMILAEAAAGRSSRLKVRHFPNTQALVRDLPGHIQEGDVVLAKGSRGMRLEEAVQVLRAWSPSSVRIIKKVF